MSESSVRGGVAGGESGQAMTGTEDAGAAVRPVPGAVGDDDSLFFGGGESGCFCFFGGNSNMSGFYG